MSAFDLAVLGADDPLGEAVLQILEEREVPVGRLYALSVGEADSSVTFRGQEWPCEPAEGFDFGRAQALLVASRTPVAARLVEAARTRRPAMPIRTVDDLDPAPALAVSRVLRTLTALGGPLSADAFVALPVSYAGQDAVEELATQSRGLFNMESPDAEVFPLRIAFNLLPHDAATSPQDIEDRLRAACARLVDDASVEFSVVWAPLFFGAAAQLHVRVDAAVDAHALRAALRHRDDLVLMEADLPAATPTPATDAQGSEAVFVGRIRGDAGHFRFWLVFDPLQMEAGALVSAVENWIDKPATSMLT
ncbi:MAG: hypothetical protein FJ209_07460 [Betaproteobacteria bacterium]|nr:hypothetical protein [Betaproteobacteria bacterium]